MRLLFLSFTKIAKLNTREMFYNNQIAKLNTRKMQFFFNREIKYSRNLIPLSKVQSLRERNPEFKPRVFMADKDFNERAIIKELFPTAAVLICLPHSLRSFKREISDKALRLAEGAQVVLKELFQIMCCARSEHEYTKHYERFM